MKKKLTLLSCLSLVYFFLGFSTVNAQQTFQTTTESVIGLLQYLPPGYDANSNKYPLVIFLHGIGERGANSTNPSTLESTIYSVDNLGPPKYAKDGYNFPFILVSPQLKNNYGSWPTSYVLEVINWAKNKFRVDEKRIYITGLSLGGGGTWSMLQDYPQLFASSAVICGGYNSPSKASKIAAENLPVWAFHGDADPTVPLSTTANMVNAINASQPTPNPKAKLTIYPGVKHDAWNKAYATGHTYHDPNVYEWLLSYTNTKNGSNFLPTAHAGVDKTYSTASSIDLAGSGTDSDGSISSYRWTKISGPSSAISNSTAASTIASVSTAGTYVFRLTVTDNGGATDSDYVTVAVGTSSSPTNAAPTASAGSDITLKLPSSTVNVTGSGQDSDGTIKSYSWTKVSGGTASLSNANTSILTAYQLEAGTYVFRLTVTDDKGATDYDDVTVVVLSEDSSSTTTSPVANAGSNINLTLPATTARMYGSATGTIVSYNWAKVSGPFANLSNVTTSTLTAWKLVQGTYVFRLTVKDNNGVTDYDDVTVVVNANPNL